jgi:hypothetical protein
MYCEKDCLDGGDDDSSFAVASPTIWSQNDFQWWTFSKWKKSTPIFASSYMRNTSKSWHLIRQASRQRAIPTVRLHYTISVFQAFARFLSVRAFGKRMDLTEKGIRRVAQILGDTEKGNHPISSVKTIRSGYASGPDC